MAKRKQLIWSTILENKISLSNTRSSTSVEESHFSYPMPVDVIINILWRLPLKSIAQCRCVSKLWSSILRRPNYNQLFPIKSPDTPKILFTFKVGSNLFFYSSSQPQNPDNNSSIVATRHEMNLGPDLHQLCRPVGGLFCSQHTGKNSSWAVISNPMTGESVITPKLTIEGIHLKEWLRGKADYCFGYDPIDNHFKVLRITRLCVSPENKTPVYAKYHVLTVGTGDGNGNLTWRKIQCSTLHYPLDENGMCENGICINSVLFYPAFVNNRKHMIVCFDVRSEKLSFISVDEDLGLPIHRYLVLINYNGKLGVNFTDVTHMRFELWVLEDVKKHKWSKHIYKLPHPWLNGANYVRPAGMVSNGEILLYQMYTENPFRIFYYNLEKKTMRSVTIEVPELEKFNHFAAYIFANYVEDLKLM